MSRENKSARDDGFVTVTFRAREEDGDAVAQIANDFGVRRQVVLSALLDSFNAFSSQMQIGFVGAAHDEWAREKAERRMRIDMESAKFDRPETVDAIVPEANNRQQQSD